MGLHQPPSVAPVPGGAGASLGESREVRAQVRQAGIHGAQGRGGDLEPGQLDHAGLRVQEPGLVGQGAAIPTPPTMGAAFSAMLKVLMPFSSCN